MSSKQLHGRSPVHMAHTTADRRQHDNNGMSAAVQYSPQLLHCLPLPKCIAYLVFKPARMKLDALHVSPCTSSDHRMSCVLIISSLLEPGLAVAGTNKSYAAYPVLLQWGNIHVLAARQYTWPPAGCTLLIHTASKMLACPTQHVAAAAATVEPCTMHIKVPVHRESGNDRFSAAGVMYPKHDSASTAWYRYHMHERQPMHAVPCCATNTCTANRASSSSTRSR